MPRLTTRDYKRKSRGSSAAKLKEFGLGVIVGAVLASAAFLIYGAHARHRAAATPSSHTHAGSDSEDVAPHAPAPDDTSSSGADGAASSDPAAQSASASGTQAQHYDFYRMLPSFKVPVRHDDDRASRPPPPPTQPTVGAIPGGAYLLQVGSYRSTAEADQVRARLARVGISAQVQRVVDGSRTWNRVRIGPLSDSELGKVREALRTANIHALLIRADR